MIEDGFRRVPSGETTLEELLRVVPFGQIEAGEMKNRQAVLDSRGSLKTKIIYCKPHLNPIIRFT